MLYMFQVFLISVIGSVTIKMIIDFMNLLFLSCWILFMRMKLGNHNVCSMIFNLNHEPESLYRWKPMAICSYQCMHA